MLKFLLFFNTNTNLTDINLLIENSYKRNEFQMKVYDRINNISFTTEIWLIYMFRGYNKLLIVNGT